MGGNNGQLILVLIDTVTALIFINATNSFLMYTTKHEFLEF
mgnify:FL=1